MWHLHQIRSNPLFFLAVPKTQEKLFLPLSLSLEIGKQFWFSAKWFLFASSLSNHLFSCSIFPKIRCSLTLGGGELLFYSFICLSQSGRPGCSRPDHWGLFKTSKIWPHSPLSNGRGLKTGQRIRRWVTVCFLDYKALFVFVIWRWQNDSKWSS